MLRLQYDFVHRFVNSLPVVHCFKGFNFLFHRLNAKMSFLTSQCVMRGRFIFMPNALQCVNCKPFWSFSLAPEIMWLVKFLSHCWYLIFLFLITLCEVSLALSSMLLAARSIISSLTSLSLIISFYDWFVERMVIQWCAHNWLRSGVSRDLFVLFHFIRNIWNISIFVTLFPPREEGLIEGHMLGLNQLTCMREIYLE